MTEAEELRAELAAAQRTIETIGARLEQAERFLRTAATDASEAMDVWDMEVDAFLASGSSTGEATRRRRPTGHQFQGGQCVDCHQLADTEQGCVGSVDRKQPCAHWPNPCDCRKHEPAAPSPASEAPGSGIVCGKQVGPGLFCAQLAGHESPCLYAGPLPTAGLASSICLAHLPSDDGGWNDVTRANYERDYGASPPCTCPAPASAQGTTELEERFRELQDDHTQLARWYQTLDKRVAAVESVTRKLDADVALLVPQHMGLQPYPEPPQPAPVERHAETNMQKETKWK
jgi:hypothetical protein